MTRIIGPPKSRRRHWTFLACLVAALSVGMVFISGASAVHNLGLFELDGNTTNAATAGDDWSNLYNSGGSPASTLPTCTKAAPNSCFEAFSFNADKIGKSGDTSYFTGGGSKDRNDISQWLWGTNDQSPDKNDITNAFAASYHKSNGKLVLYFGSDRFAVNGDAQMGFWFNQSAICLAGGTPVGVDPNCPASTPNQASHAGQFVNPDTGDVANHTDGDILVLINFNNGGAIGLAGVYTWQGGVGGAPVQSLFGTDQADCVSLSNPNDDFCATVNKVDLGAGEPPWPYAGKGKAVGQYPTSAFIEGGINLEDVQGAGSCFPSFLAETRSSSGPSSGISLDATLKDFALHSFQRCGATLSTTPKNSDGTGDPPTSIGTAGSAVVTDNAHLEVTGPTSWTGTLKFFLCKVDSPGTCDGTTNVGTQVGTTQNIGGADNKTDYLSAQAEVTAAGRYCWRGVFTSNTAGVPSRTDSSSGECFTIGPVTPTLTTTAVDAAGNPIHPASGPDTIVDFGNPVYDKATISGTANEPLSANSGINTGTIPATPRTKAGGTITFTLYGPAATTSPTTAECTTVAKDANGTAMTPITTDLKTSGVNSGDGTYPAGNPSSVSFTPGAPGYYFWKASYGGDLPNTTGAPLDANGAIIQHNADCSVSAERVQVRRIPTEIRSAQSWIPNDTAEIKSSVSGDNIQAGGSVAFTLYSNATCDGTNASSVKYTESHTIVAADITSGVATVSTANTGAAPPNGYTITTNKTDAAGTAVNYSWKVVYTPASGDTAHLGRQSACTPAGANNVPPASIEKFTITYTNDNSGGTALP